MTGGDQRVLAGLRLLQARQWYSAHEAFEPLWLEARGDERDFLQGLIHVAVSFEHLRRGNPRGALSQWNKAQPKLGLLGIHPFGVDISTWQTEIGRFFAEIDLERRAQLENGGTPMDPIPDESSWPVPNIPETPGRQRGSTT